MTAKELYQWAVENECEDKEIRIMVDELWEEYGHFYNEVIPHSFVQSDIMKKENIEIFLKDD